MKLYKSIIKESWQQTIRNKYLWFFGLFSVLLGNGGEYDVFFHSIDQNPETTTIWSGFLSQIFIILQNISSLFKLMWTDPAKVMTALALITFLFLVFLFVYWMMNISQIAIVDATSKAQRQKEHSLAKGMQKGITHFWPVFTLNTILKTVVFVSLWLIAKTSTSTLSVALIVVLVPIVICLSFVLKYAIAYIVIRKEKLLDALKAALILFKKNWIISLEVAFILYLITIAGGIIFIILTINIRGFYEVLSNISPLLSFDLLTKAFPITLFIAFAFVGSLLSVFQISTWARLFMELDNKGAKSKIERVFDN